MPIDQLNESTRITDPTLPKDRLGSKQFATYVDVLGEGVIGGFPSAIDAGYTEGTANYNNAALKDIYLNGTQVVTSGADVTNLQDTDYNFTDVGFDTRFGTSNQTYISGIAEIETENNVSVNVTNGSPVTRTITNTSINAVRVTIAFPRLEKYEDNGDIVGAEVSLSIQIQHNGGGYTTAITDVVKGRSSSAYFRDYRVNLSGAFPVDVRVVRNTADSTDTKLINACTWTSYTEIIDQQRPYADTAHLALRFDAENFPQIPTRMYKVRGIKVKIPVNATVQSDGSLTFSGAWNGTFKAAKETTTCPAWILYDLLTNSRYGYGDQVSESQLDKFAFYSCSVYNNAQIDNGLGGTEARFAFNGSIQRQGSAYGLINNLCATMRVMPYWSVGALTISQDSPKDSSYLFTLANVADGGFTYSGSSVKTRATQINVSYFDNDSQSIDWEEVQDANMVTKYGIVTKNVKAFGCTSRGQASRLGKWMLYTLFNETEVITFTTSIDAGCVVNVGDVIDVADPVRSGVRRAGRIKAATTTTVTVDNEDQTDLDATNSPTLSVVLSDGSVEKKAVSGISGAVITVSSAFSSAPNVNSVWCLENTTVQTSQWRVVSISESDSVGYTIAALTYNSSKFDYVEDGSALTQRTVSILNAIPNPPSGLTATEQIYEENSQAKVKITATWTPINGITQYRLQWRKDNGNWSQATLLRSDYEIFDATDGTYEFRVFSINAALKPSATPATISYTAVGKTAVPIAPTNLTYEPIDSKSGRLTWDATTELDVRLGGKVKIKSSNLTDGTGTWNNSVELIAAKSGVQTEAIIPSVTGEVLIAFEDSGGRTSVATSVVIDPPDAIGNLGVLVRREDQDSPPFQGVKTDCFYSDDFDALCLDGGSLMDGITDFDAILNFDYLGDVKSSGTYTFVNALDLGAAFALDLQRRFVTRGFLPEDLIDGRQENIDKWTDFDGGIIDDVNAALQVRATNNDPASGGATWGSWQPFVNGTFNGRGFQFRTALTSNDVDENILVDELGYTATMQQRTEQSTGTVSSGAATKTVSFGSAFFTGTADLGGANSKLPSVGITAHNLASGDYIEMGTVTGSQFQVTFKNSGGSAVSRNFNWSAVGWGKGV